MDIGPPRCEVCLDLEWRRLPEDSGDGYWERRLKVPYQSLRKAKDCQTCAAVTLAISEFCKPLQSFHADLLEFLESSQIRIFVRDGWTAEVLIWSDENLVAEPYFAVEMYAEKGPYQALAYNPWVGLRSVESSSKIPICRVANEVAPTLDLSTCTRFLVPKIQLCDAMHACCRSKSLHMPSRLLYVGSKAEPLCLRLDARPVLKPYVALSHCWGDESAISTTTKGTIEDRLHAIPLPSLPKSFQDAISITRAINIEYLWIDSLCIIQDDSDDWKAESVKMAKIYSGAYLTIAATGASSAVSGCLSARWHETELGVKIPHALARHQSDQVSEIHGVKVRYSSKAHTQFAGDLEPPTSGAPLWNRAWAVQERVLSRRLIHFHGEEMIWECREQRDCECGYLSWNLNIERPSVVSALFGKSNGANPRPGTRLEMFEKWLEIVHEFTKLELTYELDRLPAISGIASSLGWRMHSSYAAGVWQYRLGHGLLWRKMPYQRSRRVVSKPDQYVPSWSWASVQLLSYKAKGLHTYHDRDIVIDKHFCAVSPELSIHDIKSIIGTEDARLQIRGLTIACTLTHRHDVKSHIYPTHLLKFRGEMEFAYVDITCDDNDAQADSEVTCILLGARSSEFVMSWEAESLPGEYIVQYSLVLQCDATGIYRRIGMSEHDCRKMWFDDAEVTSIEII